VKAFACRRRRAILSAGLIMVISLPPLATFAGQPQVKFGFRAGAGLSSLRGDWFSVECIYETPILPKRQLGFSGGVFVQMALGRAGFMLQPEVMYVMKGCRVEFPDVEATGFDMVMKVKTAYLEVPVLLKYNIPGQGRLKPNLFVGPVAALNLSSKIEFENVPPYRTDDFEEGDIENTKQVDLGVTFGGGMNVGMGSTGMLILDIRYVYGLIGAFSYVGYFDEGEIYWTTHGHGIRLKNGDIQATVGYTF